MTPPLRPSGHHLVLKLKLVGAVLIMAIGVLVVIIGAGIALVELYHRARSEHAFAWMPFLWSAALMGIGGLIIQTGDLKETVAIVQSTVPLLNSIRPGGNRATDPKTKPPPGESAP